MLNPGHRDRPGPRAGAESLTLTRSLTHSRVASGPGAAAAAHRPPGLPVLTASDLPGERSESVLDSGVTQASLARPGLCFNLAISLSVVQAGRGPGGPRRRPGVTMMVQVTTCKFKFLSSLFKIVWFCQ